MSELGIVSIEGRVTGFWLDDVIQPPETLRISDTDASLIKYTVRVLTDEVDGEFVQLAPTNRTGRNVKINSAKFGTPCKLEIALANPPVVTLYLHEEEVPFGPCPPAGLPPAFGGGD